MRKTTLFPPVKAVGGADLPAVTDADNGKVLSVNNGVWGVSPKSLLPQEVVIAPEQTVTVTGDTIAKVVTADGYVVPPFTPRNWLVTVDGYELILSSNGNEYDYVDEISGKAYAVMVQNGEIIFACFDANSKEQPPALIPGNYTAKILEASVTNGDRICVFFQYGNGVLDKTATEIENEAVAGKFVCIGGAYGAILSGYVAKDDGETFYFTMVNADTQGSPALEVMKFLAETPDSYPVYTE